MSKYSQFKNGANQWLSRTMFVDFKDYCRQYDYTPNFIYTLQDNDTDGYPSLKRLYMEAMDPSEYSFAMSHLGGWDHWLELSNAAFMQEIVTKWREELKTKITSEAVARMRKIASDPDNKNYYNANKYLAEEGWNVDTKRLRAGRRSKVAVEREAEKLTQKDTNLRIDTNNDFERLFKN